MGSELAHLFEVQTKTYKREWKFTRQTVTADGGHGFAIAKIAVTDSDDADRAIELADPMVPGEHTWEQRGDTHYVAVAS